VLAGHGFRLTMTLQLQTSKPHLTVLNPSTVYCYTSIFGWLRMVLRVVCDERILDEVERGSTNTPHYGCLSEAKIFLAVAVSVRHLAQPGIVLVLPNCV
jgi:hypothetical protein